MPVKASRVTTSPEGPQTTANQRRQPQSNTCALLDAAAEILFARRITTEKLTILSSCVEAHLQHGVHPPHGARTQPRFRHLIDPFLDSGVANLPDVPGAEPRLQSQPPNVLVTAPHLRDSVDARCHPALIDRRERHSGTAGINDLAGGGACQHGRFEHPSFPLGPKCPSASSDREGATRRQIGGLIWCHAG